MENTANLWLFTVQKIVSEYAERIYARRRRETQRLIMVRHDNFFRFLLFVQDGLE
jgi:hypothetical protein